MVEMALKTWPSGRGGAGRRAQSPDGGNLLVVRADRNPQPIRTLTIYWPERSVGEEEDLSAPDRPGRPRRLEKWAADELRSVNAHIEYLLRQALIKAGRLKPGGRKDPERRDGDESTPSPG